MPATASTITSSFPHEVNKFSGVTVLSNVIVKIRLTGIYRALLREDMNTIDRILKDTIRIFRTARANYLDRNTYNYLLTNLLRMTIELRLGYINAALGRMQVMNVAISLPDVLI